MSRDKRVKIRERRRILKGNGFGATSLRLSNQIEGVNPRQVSASLRKPEEFVNISGGKYSC